MDGKPPAPSEIERQQSRAGHIMSDTEIAEMKDLLHRAGVNEAKTRDLDQFETLVTDIALRLINDDDEMDPATAGMDILDAVNERIMTESVRRKAGTWYDPMERVREILEELGLPEDLFADVQARMNSQADEFLRDRDGETDSEYDDEMLSFGDIAMELMSIRDGLKQGGDKRLDDLIQKLQTLDESIGDLRFRTWTGEAAELRKRAGLSEACQCQVMDDVGVPNGVLQQVIPEIRGIAINYVTDAGAKQRLQEIAEQLSTLK